MNADDMIRNAVQAAFDEVSASRSNTAADHEREIERLKDLIGNLYPDIDSMVFCDRCGCQLDTDSYADEGDYCDGCREDMESEGEES